MQITCEIEEIELDGDFGSIPSVQATCSRCDHTTESYGTGGASIRRCLVVMREECPRGQENFYVAEGGDDD
jgi:hypothetical protein